MLWRLSVIAAALLALLAPLPPDLIERVYAAGLFPVLQALVTGFSNRTGTAWLDVLGAGITAGFLLLSVRDWRRVPRRRALARIAWRACTVGAILYLAFLAGWGLNYRRVPLRVKVRFNGARVTPQAVQALGAEAVRQVNTLYAPAHARGFGAPDRIDAELAAAQRAAAAMVPGLSAPVPARPKRSGLDLYFRRAGVAGMTDPFFLETLVASDTLPFERPQVVAHEWAHLGGIADEGEASFAAWATCMRGNEAHRYSGWLFLFGEVADSLPPAAATALRDTLADGPRADLRAIRDRHDREVSPLVSGAGWRVYDRYLKANRVGAGTRSYGEVVELVLGAGVR